MSNIETVTLDGTEIKVEGLGGQNTIITNRGTANLYASAYENITPDGDNVAAILPGGAMNLQDTNGTVYLLGTGKVQLQGTDTAYLPMSLGGASGGGGSAGSGVSQEYVDSADIVTLNTAKRYIDSEITAVNGEIATSAKETLTAAKGYADTEIFDLKAYIGYTDSDIYGLEADFENNKFTRLAGAVGKNPGADFDFINAFGGRRRCAVANDGTVLAYYGDSNYEDDGLIGEDIIVQTMVEQPKFYYKIVPLKTEKIDDADGYYLRKARYYISDTPKPGFRVHPAFVQNGVEIDKIYLSAYEGSLYDVSISAYRTNDEQIADFDNDILCSLKGVKPASGTTQNLTVENARKLARNRGAGWGITTIQTLSATQLLFAIEYAAFNSQTSIGNGNTQYGSAPDTGNNALRNGVTSSLGNSSGAVTHDGVQSVSYRGEENLWGNIWKMLDGISVSKPSDFSAGKNGNINVGANRIPCIYGSGYASCFVYSDKIDWVFIASGYTGTSAVPIGDRMWNMVTDGNMVICGGLPHHKTLAGLFCISLDSSDTTHNRMTSARLIYIPQTTEVTS